VSLVLLFLVGAFAVVGSGANGVAGAGVRRVPVASFRPAANPPIVAGDSFTYGYSDYGGTPAPTATFSGTLTITATSGASFMGLNNLTELYLTDSLATEIDSDSQYLGFAAGKAGSVEELYFGDSIDYQDDATDETYVTDVYPAGLVQDQYPEAAGLRWSPSAMDYYDEQEVPADYSYFYEDAETKYADGSYSTLETFNEDSATTYYTDKVSPDGSALSTDPGFPTITIAVPVYETNSYAIPVTSTNPSTGKGSTVYVPDWYPGHAAASPPAIGLVEDVGLSITPRACLTRSGFAAFRIHSTRQITDPLEGTVTTTVADTYDAAGLGTICSIMTTKIANYDYSKTGRYTSGGLSTKVSVLTSESGPKPLSSFISSRGGLTRAFMPHIPLELFTRGRPRVRHPRRFPTL
jgi:hypothetical protein